MQKGDLRMRMIIWLAGGIVWGLLFTAAMTLAGFPMGEGTALVSGLVFGLVGYPCCGGRMKSASGASTRRWSACHPRWRLPLTA